MKDLHIALDIDKVLVVHLLFNSREELYDYFKVANLDPKRYFSVYDSYYSYEKKEIINEYRNYYLHGVYEFIQALFMLPDFETHLAFYSNGVEERNKRLKEHLLKNCFDEEKYKTIEQQVKLFSRDDCVDCKKLPENKRQNVFEKQGHGNYKKDLIKLHPDKKNTEIPELLKNSIIIDDQSNVSMPGQEDCFLEVYGCDIDHFGNLSGGDIKKITAFVSQNNFYRLNQLCHTMGLILTAVEKVNAGEQPSISEALSSIQWDYIADPNRPFPRRQLKPSIAKDMTLYNKGLAFFKKINPNFEYLLPDVSNIPEAQQFWIVPELEITTLLQYIEKFNSLPEEVKSCLKQEKLSFVNACKVQKWLKAKTTNEKYNILQNHFYEKITSSAVNLSTQQQEIKAFLDLINPSFYVDADKIAFLQELFSVNILILLLQDKLTPQYFLMLNNRFKHHMWQKGIDYLIFLNTPEGHDFLSRHQLTDAFLKDFYPTKNFSFIKNNFKYLTGSWWPYLKDNEGLALHILKHPLFSMTFCDGFSIALKNKLLNSKLLDELQPLHAVLLFSNKFSVQALMENLISIDEVKKLPNDERILQLFMTFSSNGKDRCPGYVLLTNKTLTFTGFKALIDDSLNSANYIFNLLDYAATKPHRPFSFDFYKAEDVIKYLEGLSYPKQEEHLYENIM